MREKLIKFSALIELELDFSQEDVAFANKKELVNVVSYNPHTGKGKQNDNAAHCRSVACVEFIKWYNQEK